MRKAGVLVLIVGLLLAVFVNVMAQDATAEPTAEAMPEATTEATAEATQPAGPQDSPETVVTRVRFANLSPDAPTLMVYADGELTSVQQLPFPSVSGWVEFTGSPALMLAEPGATVENAVVSPFTVQGNNWTTIAVVGSNEAGTLNAVAFNENVTNIPEGCARVTVFHAVEGALTVTISDDQGSTLVSGLGFPGGGSAGGSASSSLGDCASQIRAMNPDAEATADASGDDAGQVVDTTPAGPLQCTALVSGQAQTNPQAEATAEATADAGTAQDANQPAPGRFVGSTFGSCGFTFDVPAGAYNLQAGSAGTAGDAMGSTGSTELAADTYYFVAVVGTPDNPQTVVVSFGGGDVTSLFDDSRGTGTQAGAAPEATPEATLEATAEATPEATPGS